MGKVVKHEACPKCRAVGNDTAGDNLAVYDDGSAYCFACKYTTSADTSIKTISTNSYMPLSDRNITLETCRKYDYRAVKDSHTGELVFAAHYYDRTNNVVGQKFRYADKKFRWSKQQGVDLQAVQLFGQQLFKEGGKRLIITEGEIDAMSAYQALGGKWPVVSVPHGAQSAARSIKENIEYINSFEEVVLCFDNDEPGNKATAECVNIIRPGKCRIAKLKYKDANEYLQKDAVGDLVRALWDAVLYKPVDIKHISEISPNTDTIAEIWTYPWPNWTVKRYGRRSGEICLHCAGTGSGKSTLIRQLIMSDARAGNKVGVMMLEESNADTLNDLIALVLRKPVKKILAARKINSVLKSKGLDPVEFNVIDDLSDEEYYGAVEELKSLGIFFYDHFGSLEPDELLGKLEYLIVSMGCKLIYLDHISIAISGNDNQNERQELDKLVTELKTLVKTHGAHIDVVSHLKRPPGNISHEEGAAISLNHLRGSQILAQIPDCVIAYERNRQHPNKEIASTMIVRCLKDRYGGDEGIFSALRFDKETTELIEVPIPTEEVFDDQPNLPV